MRAGEGGGKLRRLPPGRHGLSREFVTSNQRERLIAGMIATVSEHGYRDTSVGRISAAAGVSRQTFYDYFSNKEECFLASYDLLESHTLDALRETGADERGWVAKLRRRTGLLLEILSANPDLVRFSLIAPPATGEELLGRERRFLQNLVAVLVAEAPKSTPRHPDEIELEAVAGGLASLLATRVGDDGDRGLEGLGPELVQLVLTPFLGRERAATESRTN